MNIRSIGENSIRTRPGYVSYFSTNSNNSRIMDMRSYASINTDSLPRVLAVDYSGGVWLDTSVKWGTMGGNAQFGVLGASMVPFRPAESPQAWMYVSTAGDYQKFSVPDANNNVTNWKVGIAEPQVQVEAAPRFQGATIFTGVAANWANGGTAGSTSDGNRSTDTAGFLLADPVDSTRQSMQVGNNNVATYGIGEVLKVGNNTAQVIDVIPALSANNLTVRTIYYTAGNNGNCVIVPTQIPNDTGIGFADFLGSLRRGSLMTIDGNETIFVQGVVAGQDGQVAILSSTNNSHAANAALLGLPTVILYSAGASNASVSAPMISSNVATGVGTLTFPLSTNPFRTQFSAPVDGNAAYPQQDDYFHLSVAFSDPSQLTQMLVMFTLAANNNYNGDLYYYAVRPGDLVSLVNGNQTLLPAILQAATNEIIGNLDTSISAPAQTVDGNNQWTEIMVPISAFQRLGGDSSKSLGNVQGMQLQVTANNNITFSFGGAWVGGGGQPDVGNNGAPYRYRAVPFSSATGIRGNPSPEMRYGVMPRRQPVLVKTSALNASYDPQIDTWEVYRTGGTLTSYRYLGSVPTGSDFTDYFFDDAAAGGSGMQTDNTEPWPSIDVPWSQTGNLTAYGQYLVANNSVMPATVTRWLPGTLLRLQGGTNPSAYTLRTRPLMTAGNNGVLFHFEEMVGAGAQPAAVVIEPVIARQPLPYVWGPDEYGTVFGCGDTLRPGVLYLSKQYGPDAAPSKQVIELTEPSEPLLGGRCVSGVTIVASSKRWWQLTFQGGGYAKLEVPIGKRLASPWGMDTDGALVYFWATDGICVTSAQGPAKSLTDEDLYNIFPHGGVSGVSSVRLGVTYYAPDFSRADTFRLAVRENYLYATYQDSAAFPHTLVCDLRNGAWTTDVYADLICVPYAINQPDAPPAENYPTVLLGDVNGKVWRVQDYTNDNGTPIFAAVATYEWDGGDIRQSELWGDLALDCIPAAVKGVSATPVSNSTPVGNATIIPSGGRVLAVVSTGGGILQTYIGMLVAWTDDMSVQARHTSLQAWQPSWAEQVDTTTDRIHDWDNCGTDANKFFQGCVIAADTLGANKNIVIQDSDTGASHVLQPAAVNHSGNQTKPYSFVAPFLAHSVRDVPLDKVPWRRFSIRYVFEPTPEAVQTWTTQWTALSGKGYKHIPRIEVSYSASAPVTLAVTSYDGISPAVLTLPATGGVTQKALLTLTLNKGQLYRFSAQSAGNFQLFLEDIIVWCGEWGRGGEYVPYRNLGGSFGDKASI
jgi:hypothetical protein